MKTNSRLFRLASIAALVATCALPFWNIGARISAADGGGGQTIQNVHVTADSERVATGIDGYVLSSPSAGKFNVEVLSETRGATIEIDTVPTEGVCTVTVTMADTAEALVVQNNGWDGTIKINGREVASWEHLGGDDWKYTNFNRLKNFTSWNVFSDTFDDGNFITEMSIFGILITLIVTLLIAAITIEIMLDDQDITVDNNCATWASECIAAGYDPNNPSCYAWFSECPQSGFASGYCAELSSRCDDGDDEACDLWLELCNP